MSTPITPQVGVPLMEEEELQSSFLLQQSSDGSSAPAKKKRGLPGNPDPDAEVVALSPRTLMATNRYMCDVCHKGFQRDQNLQLHRRGHNLPWKLKQRAGAPKKRVYVCPEVNCVHHDRSRALGDLTGIKKHYCRKHGEKKWKCDKCSKRYAVQSDWKAHSKICGTKEYRCDCGTIFSRRDSFITHRAFCDALAEENKKQQQQQGLAAIEGTLENQSPQLGSPSIPTSNYISTTKASVNLSLSNQITNGPLHPTFPFQVNSILEVSQQPTLQDSSFQLGGGCNSAGLSPLANGSGFMSATALLQKAAAMGAMISDDSIAPVLPRGSLGHVTSAKSCGLVQDPSPIWMNSSAGSGLEHGRIDSSPCSLVLQGGLLDSHLMMQMGSGNLLEGVFMDRAQNDFDEGMTGEGGNRTVDFLGLGPAGHLTNKGQCFDDNMTDQLNLHGLQSCQTVANDATALDNSIWNF